MSVALVYRSVSISPSFAIQIFMSRKDTDSLDHSVVNLIKGCMLLISSITVESTLRHVAILQYVVDIRLYFHQAVGLFVAFSSKMDSNLPIKVFTYDWANLVPI